MPPRPVAGRRAAGIGLLVGTGLDLLLADPRRWHPVAGFGSLAGRVEKRTYADSRRAGVAHAATLTALAGGTGLLVQRAVRRGPRATAAGGCVVAIGTFVVLGATGLRRQAALIESALREGDLAAARALLPTLCGRDPEDLRPAEIIRAVVESVAENTSDAAVAPLFWGAVAGLPGLLTYRAVNTLDAMVGHRSPRYARFGWASARLDDLANLVPSRLAAALAVSLAPLVGGDRLAALRVWRRDGSAHPSPNAGQVEAAFAGVLGRSLGGPSSYGGRPESRSVLGVGPPPDVGDIARARRLSAAVVGAATLLAVSGRANLDRRRTGPR